MKVDTFALAVVMYFMITTLQLAEIDANFDATKIPKEYYFKFEPLLRKMLARDPVQRPSIDQVLDCLKTGSAIQKNNLPSNTSNSQRSIQLNKTTH